MGRQKKISIPAPCDEDWETMQVSGSGNKFCQNCQKEVIDFSEYSTQELIAYFQNKTNNSVCGKLSQEKLRAADRALESRKGSQNKWLGIAASAILWASSCASGKDAMQYPNCAEQQEEKDESLLHSNYEVIGAVSMEKLSGIIIRGKILNTEEEPLIGASIEIEGYHLGTSTDIKGNFDLTLNEKKTNSKVLVSYIGHKSILFR